MNDPLETVGYLHRTANGCFSVDPLTYERPRELVLRSAAEDRIEYLELGLAEWRELALMREAQVKFLKSELIKYQRRRS